MFIQQNNFNELKKITHRSVNNKSFSFQPYLHVDMMVFSFDPAPDLQTTTTHPTLDLICESCLYLCPGTCLPSRSNRTFPVDV